MKYKNYPKFKRNELRNKYESLPKKEKEIINDFINYVSITSTSKLRHENNRRSITSLRVLTNKPLDKLELKDIRDFLALINMSYLTRASRNEIKASIKRFLKWKYKDWSERFNELRDITLKFGLNEEKINHNTLLKPHEIEKIISIEKRLLWKTFFISLYESGLRPKELRTLTWDKIKFNVEGEVSEINIYATKTSKSRSVYVKDATKFLKKLKENRIDTKNPLVFPGNNPLKPLSKDLVSVWLKRLSKRAINREVNPYLLRHTRATELYNEIPAEAQKILGHNKDMREVYHHLSPDKIKKAMVNVIYKIEDEYSLPEEKKHELENKVQELEKISNLQRKVIDNFKEDFKIIQEGFFKAQIQSEKALKLALKSRHINP